MCDSSSIGLMSTAMQGAGAITATVGQYNKSTGEKNAYNYQSQVAKNNAVIAEYQAQDAMHRGATTQNNLQLRTAQLRGSQEALMASRGLSLSEGSPLNILTDTDFMGQRDVNTARDNTAKEVYQHRVQEGNYESDSSMLKTRADSVHPFSDAASTLLTGAGKVASGWYARNKTVDV